MFDVFYFSENQTVLSHVADPNSSFSDHNLTFGTKRKIEYFDKMRNVSDDEHDNLSVTDSLLSNNNQKFQLEDRRKKNKGSVHRKRYQIDVKRRAISLRDEGLSFEDIAKILDTAKSNIEKWCSKKVNTLEVLINFS